MVTISLENSEAVKMQSALIALAQATTYAPNLVDYSQDIYWALELLNKLKKPDDDQSQSSGDP